MTDLSLQGVSLASTSASGDAPFALTVRFAVERAVAFDIDISLDIDDAISGARVAHAQLAAAGWDVSWLPRGNYEAHALSADAGLAPGRYVAQIALWERRGGDARKAAESSIAFEIVAPARGGDRPPGEPRRIGYVYLIPALLIFGAFTLAPLVHAIWLSLFQWDGVTAGKWVGLSNYSDVFSDPVQRKAFGHALILIVFYALLPTAIGLLLAGAVARTQVRGFTFFRVVLFLPQVVGFNAEATSARRALLCRRLEAALGRPFPAEELQARLRTLITDELGLPSRLRDLGVARADLPFVAQSALRDPIVATNPRPIRSSDEVMAVLEAAW